MERPTAPAELADGQLPLVLGPFEIVTLRVARAGA
ncbi:hypothetical protein [Streptomyces silvisoli]